MRIILIAAIPVLLYLSMLSSARAFPRLSIRSINSISVAKQNSKMVSISRDLSSSTTVLASSVFNNGPFWKSSGIFLGANVLGYVINLFSPTHYHVDLLGTGAFAIAALPSLISSPVSRIQISSAATIAWSVKLATYLFYRVLSTKHDARLDAQLVNPASAAQFWFVSALWGILCSLPHTLGTTSSLPGTPLTRYMGIALFGVGWITETLADYQKWVFKQSHPGQFCSVGLWSVVQHPNWLGNLLLWTGILVLNAPALVEPKVIGKMVPSTLGNQIWRYRRLALACIGPAFMWLLFDAQATGKILGDTHDANRQKYGYGTDPTYTKYIDQTPLIWPINPMKRFNNGNT